MSYPSVKGCFDQNLMNPFVISLSKLKADTITINFSIVDFHSEVI